MINKKAMLMNYIKGKHGIAAYSDIQRAGFHKATLNALTRSGQIRKVDRGFYRLSSGASLTNPDLVAVSIKAPNAVVCLISALYFYGATDEIPQQVDLAVRESSRSYRIKYPPVQFYHFAKNAWGAGIEERKMDGHTVRIYNLAKTVADCFKFRSKVGIDVAQKALKNAVLEKHIAPAEIMRYAKICRVHNVVQPMLEMIL
jgi:predicted transcriptional regulator of viral defense system